MENNILANRKLIHLKAIYHHKLVPMVNRMVIYQVNMMRKSWVVSY
jgi:hypothetical protein